jgi:hypothetical protein
MNMSKVACRIFAGARPGGMGMVVPSGVREQRLLRCGEICLPEIEAFCQKFWRLVNSCFTEIALNLNVLFVQC